MPSLVKPRVVVTKHLDDRQRIRPLRYLCHPAENERQREKKKGREKNTVPIIIIITWDVTNTFTCELSYQRDVLICLPPDFFLCDLGAHMDFDLLLGH